ncbi:DsbA family protein [Azospirillum sp. A29]|uniref:DsbA family protein n=1 Tax=unclassified Azospirillum TaxID=2630922 RepID=UPI00366B67E0
MKRPLLTLPVLLALSVTAPASAADVDGIIDALMNRVERLTQQNTKLTIENEQLRKTTQVRDHSDVMPENTAQLLRKAADAATITPPAAVAASTALDAKQLDEYLRQWMKDNAGYVFESVNKHLAEQQQARAPKSENFAARASDLFEKDAIKAGAVTGAKVRLVMFADYNCTYCKKAQPVIDELLANNPDLQVVYRELPILSPTSRLAAQAARAAALQGKHEAFHRELYKLTEISEQSILQLAARPDIGLDVEQLRKDMTSEKVASLVTNDFNLGQSLGIQGTPFFYLDGGATMPGYAPTSQMQAMIDQARKKS